MCVSIHYCYVSITIWTHRDKQQLLLFIARIAFCPPPKIWNILQNNVMAHYKNTDLSISKHNALFVSVNSQIKVEQKWILNCETDGARTTEVNERRCNYLQVLELLWPHLNLVMTSHLETGEVEAETKGLYDHGCPTTQDTLTHTASPPATDHPGAAHVDSVRPKCLIRQKENNTTTCTSDTGSIFTLMMYLPWWESMDAFLWGNIAPVL